MKNISLFLNKNNKNNLILLFSILFSFLLTYTITLNLFLGRNAFLKTFFKYAFPAIFFVCIFVSYFLYHLYFRIVLKFCNKTTSLKLLYGPIISSVIVFIFTSVLFFKTSSILNSIGNRTDQGISHSVIHFRQLGINLNLNYLPKIFIFMFVLTFFIDLIFLLSKIKRKKLKSIISVFLSNIIFLGLTLILILLLFITQTIIGFLIAGGGVA